MIESTTAPALRCPLCHDQLPGGSVIRCSGCGTRTHERCLIDLGGLVCPTYGCDRAFALRASLEPASQPARGPSELGSLFGLGLAWVGTCVATVVLGWLSFVLSLATAAWLSWRRKERALAAAALLSAPAVLLVVPSYVGGVASYASGSPTIYRAGECKAPQKNAPPVLDPQLQCLTEALPPPCSPEYTIAKTQGFGHNLGVRHTAWLLGALPRRE